MVLSFHVIFTPKGESLGSMRFIFPEEGGSIGRDLSNSVVLPDRSKKVSRIHAFIRKEGGVYIIKDMSESGIFINRGDCAIGYQKESLINDGDMLDIGGYRLLSSCFSSDLNNPFSVNSKLSIPNEKEIAQALNLAPQPDISELVLYDDPFTDPDEASLHSPEISTSHCQKSTIDNHEIEYREQNVASLELKINNILASSFVANGTEEPDPFFSSPQQTSLQQVQNLDSKIEPVFSSEGLPVELDAFIEREGRVVAVDHFNQGFTSRHCSLMELSEMDVIKVKIEGAMQRFLEELSPEYLESMFNDCHLGWRKLRKKDLWGLYSSHFFRMMNSNEFQRKFWAYFCDQ